MVLVFFLNETGSQVLRYTFTLVFFTEDLKRPLLLRNWELGRELEEQGSPFLFLCPLWDQAGEKPF